MSVDANLDRLMGIESDHDPEQVEAVKRLSTDNFVGRYADADTASDRKGFWDTRSN